MQIGEEDRLFVLRYIARLRAAKIGVPSDAADTAWMQGLHLVPNETLEPVRDFLRGLSDDEINSVGSGDATQSIDGWIMDDGISQVTITNEYYGFLLYIDNLLKPTAIGA